MKCITCEKDKIEEDFELRSDTNKRRNTCKQCRNTYVKAYKQGREQGTIKKKGSPVRDGMIKCVRCNISKELKFFPARLDTTVGYRTTCKECRMQIMSKYYHDVYNEKRRERAKEDLQYRLMKIHRARIWKVLIKTHKKQSSAKYLGCDKEVLKSWLEFQFTEGMNWDNYGSKWTVDHVLPISLFDLTKENEQMICFNWKNLQPHKENFSKNNKIRLYEYFNVFISAHRFIQLNKMESSEYQGLNESLNWLREKLGYGKNLPDN